jgi:hypothetical protein
MLLFRLHTQSLVESVLCASLTEAVAIFPVFEATKPELTRTYLKIENAVLRKALAGQVQSGDRKSFKKLTVPEGSRLYRLSESSSTTDFEIGYETARLEHGSVTYRSRHNARYDDVPIDKSSFVRCTAKMSGTVNTASPCRGWECLERRERVTDGL